MAAAPAAIKTTMDAMVCFIASDFFRSVESRGLISSTSESVATEMELAKLVLR